MVCTFLKEYDVSLSQVYSLTTDNGVNVWLAVKLSKEDCPEIELLINEEKKVTKSTI